MKVRLHLDKPGQLLHPEEYEAVQVPAVGERIGVARCAKGWEGTYTVTDIVWLAGKDGLGKPLLYCRYGGP